MKSTRRVLGHSLLRSLLHSHRSPICLLRTARFARALRFAHSFARSLTHSLRSSWERGFCLWNKRVDFIQFQPTEPRSTSCSTSSKMNCNHRKSKFILYILYIELLMNSITCTQNLSFHVQTLARWSSFLPGLVASMTLTVIVKFPSGKIPLFSFPDDVLFFLPF